jgi:hypothetical protein
VAGDASNRKVNYVKYVKKNMPKPVARCHRIGACCVGDIIAICQWRWDNSPQFGYADGSIAARYCHQQGA